MVVNERSYRGFRVTRGDGTGEQLAILVPVTYRVLHFASAADENTDWNVANPTNPTAYYHSETTPATDYIALSHDGTTGLITSVGGTLSLNGVTNALIQVGGTTVITVAAATVTLGAADLIVANAQGLNVGSATQATISDGDGSTNLIPEGQFLGVGTAFAGGAVLLATFNATNTRAVSPKIAFVKGAAATQVATTAVADNEVLGSIIAYGSDSADFESPTAAIEFVVDEGTPAAGVMGGSLEFYTTALGGETLTLRQTIASSGLITIAAGSTPASVATTPGTAHPGSLTVTGGVGGNTSIATTGVGGIGAGFSFTAGAGGTANSATTAATGGAGGAWAVTTGAGAAAAVAGTTSTGGAGGAITCTSGAGGAVSLAVSGTATGGAAGLVTIQGGVGGAVTATTGTNVGGVGGGVSMIAGAGGAASAATDTGGAGGTITITAGAGGNGDTSGAAGAVNITAGAAGTGGNVAGGTIKLTSGAAVGSGATGAVIISNALLMDDRTITTISTDSDVVYTAAQVRTGVINRDSITANRNDSMPTAANLVAGIPGAEVGTSFFFVLNNNDTAQTLTMTTAATGITYDGNGAALAAGASRAYLVVITNVTGSSEAATVFGL